MKLNISRRALVRYVLIAGAQMPAIILPGTSEAEAPLRPVDPLDPGAKALGFVTQTQKVDARAYPSYKPSQKCATCERFQGKADDAIAGCDIFAGHSVPREGWCKVWVGKH